MMVSEAHFKFLGYGNPDAAVWFVGREEGIGATSGPSEDKKNLRSRQNFQNFMCLHQAHLTLTEKGIPIDIEDHLRRGSNRAWIWMSKFYRGINNEADWVDLKLAKEFMRFSLGRRDGQTFLTELCPIPSKTQSNATHRADFERWNKARHDKLRQLIRINSRRLVVCYGSSGKSEFAEFLGGSFESTSLPFMWRNSKNRRWVLVPFFGNGAMSHDKLKSIIKSCTA